MEFSVTWVSSSLAADRISGMFAAILPDWDRQWWRQLSFKRLWVPLLQSQGPKYHYGIYLDPQNTLQVYTIMILGPFGSPE